MSQTFPMCIFGFFTLTGYFSWATGICLSSPTSEPPFFLLVIWLGVPLDPDPSQACFACFYRYRGVCFVSVFGIIGHPFVWINRSAVFPGWGGKNPPTTLGGSCRNGRVPCVPSGHSFTLHRSYRLFLTPDSCFIVKYFSKGTTFMEKFSQGVR